MQWDLGSQGAALFLVMSLGFGVFVLQVFWGRHVWWVGLLATAAYFVAGLFISEVWFGWVTQEELQPNIDGLSFGEALLGFFVGIVIVLAARYLTRTPTHQPMATWAIGQGARRPKALPGAAHSARVHAVHEARRA